MDLDNNLSVESDNTCGINVIAFENKCMCSRSNGENYCYRISYLTSFENVTFQAIGWDFLAVLRFITDTTAFLWYESHLKLKLQGERMGTNTMPVQVQVLSMQSFWLRTQFKKKEIEKELDISQPSLSRIMQYWMSYPVQANSLKKCHMVYCEWVSV